MKELTEGAVVSMVKLSTERLSLVKPLEVPVTLIVQLSYVPSLKAEELSDCVRVTVLFPSVADDEDELPQAPPYEIVPASLEDVSYTHLTKQTILHE